MSPSKKRLQLANWFKSIDCGTSCIMLVLSACALLHQQSRNSPNDKMSPIVYVLNGPNLNLLGTRQPEIYGRETLADVEAECRRRGADLGLAIEFRQTNAEFQLIDWIHEARLRAAGIIINPAAFSHTSVAVLDALNTCEFPILEVHISNIHKREEFRHHSFVSRVAAGVICGFGTQGYALAIERLRSAHRKLAPSGESSPRTSSWSA